MKKLLVLVALLVVAAAPLFAQGSVPASAYLVAEYSNNAGPGATADARIRLINVGTLGTPLSDPVGSVCANIYVFDTQQEMIACCACAITPNGRRSINVGNDLTAYPLTHVVPANGVIKIVATDATSGSFCSATRPFDGHYAPGSLAGYFTELEPTSAGTFIVGHEMQYGNLNTTLPTPSTSEAAFLPMTCQFINYIGSGNGVCSCGSGS
jgi:hypothetical protein